MLTVAGLIATETLVGATGRSLPVLGGSGLYAAIAARAADKVSLLGIAGETTVEAIDDLGRIAQIDCSRVVTCDGNGFSCVLAYGSDNHTVVSLRSNWGQSIFHDYTLDACEGILRIFLAADDPSRQSALVRSYNGTFELGVGVNANFIEYYKQEYEFLFRHAKLITLNRSELGHFDLSLIPPTTAVVVSQAEQPIEVLFQRSSHEVAIPRVRDIVDPTGCGDAFGGALFSRWGLTSFAPDELLPAVEFAVGIARCKLASHGALGFAEFVRFSWPP